MAKKQNQSLRRIKDTRHRKKVNGGTSWTDKLLKELRAGEEVAEEVAKKRKKGKSDNAKRLTNYSI